MHAAAARIAEDRHPGRAERAWLNRYGVFAFVDGIAIQIGSAKEAAPFCKLTTWARKVKTFCRGDEWFVEGLNRSAPPQKTRTAT